MGARASDRPGSQDSKAPWLLASRLRQSDRMSKRWYRSCSEPRPSWGIVVQIPYLGVMMMVHYAHNQQPLRARATKRGGSFLVLCVVLSLVVSSTPAVSQERRLPPLATPPQRTAPAPRSPAMDVARLATEDPRLVLQHADTS